MDIPYQQLSKDALRNLITDFVCSVGDFDGYSLESKIEQVIQQLKRGTVVITFNKDSESCSIQTRESLHNREAGHESTSF